MSFLNYKKALGQNLLTLPLTQKKLISKSSLHSALAKYNVDSKTPLAFEGISLIYSLSKSEKKLVQKFKREFQKDLTKRKLLEHFAFVHEESYHITTYDLVCQNERNYIGKRKSKLQNIHKKAEEYFCDFSQSKIHNLKLFECFALSLMIKMRDEDFEKLLQYRKIFNRLMEKKLPAYIPHITLAYLVKPLKQKDYALLLQLIQNSQNKTPTLNLLGFNSGRLMEFLNMDEYRNL